MIFLFILGTTFNIVLQHYYWIFLSRNVGYFIIRFTYLFEKYKRVSEIKKKIVLSNKLALPEEKNVLFFACTVTLMYLI